MALTRGRGFPSLNPSQAPKEKQQTGASHLPSEVMGLRSASSPFPDPDFLLLIKTKGPHRAIMGAWSLMFSHISSDLLE